MVATETSLPAATLGHLALAEKQYLGLTFLQVLFMLVDMDMVYTFMLVDMVYTYMLVYMVTITLLTSFCCQPRTSVFQVRKEPALRAVYQVNLLSCSC